MTGRDLAPEDSSRRRRVAKPRSPAVGQAGDEPESEKAPSAPPGDVEVAPAQRRADRRDG